MARASWSTPRRAASAPSPSRWRSSSGPAPSSPPPAARKSSNSPAPSAPTCSSTTQKKTGPKRSARPPTARAPTSSWMMGSDFPRKNLECLDVFGRMVVFGAASRERGTIVPAALMNRCHAVVGFYLPQIMRRPDLFVPSLQEVLGWISTGDLKLTIGGTYSLEQANEAHADLEGRQTTGKLLLNP